MKMIELVDSTIMDEQMGSDHCPIGLKINLLSGSFEHGKEIA